MTRPMSEEERERALKAAAATVESYTAYDFGMSPANELLLARALLSAERGMREALRKHCIEEGTEHGQRCYWCHECDGFWLFVDEHEKHNPGCLAALSSKGEG